MRVRADSAIRPACASRWKTRASGVPAEDVPHVFERFYRGRAADAAPGSGLGLAIAKNLARLHGGDITLRSVAGQGSTFTLNLPAGAPA